MTLSNLVNSTKKKIVAGAIGLATIVGTFGGNEEGFAPFLNAKTGTNYGINIGLVTGHLQGSKFYGIELSLCTFGEYGSNFNGIQISAMNFADFHPVGEMFNNKHFNDRANNTVNGLQIGLMNIARSGNVLQLGLYNRITNDEGKMSTSFPLNYGITGDLK